MRIARHGTMEQLTDGSPAEDIININYESANLPDAIREHRPSVFKDGSGFFFCYGSDPQEGTFCCGNSPGEALNEWNKKFLEEGIKFFGRQEEGSSTTPTS